MFAFFYIEDFNVEVKSFVKCIPKYFNYVFKKTSAQIFIAAFSQ